MEKFTNNNRSYYWEQAIAACQKAQDAIRALYKSESNGTDPDDFELIRSTLSTAFSDCKDIKQELRGIYEANFDNL